MSEEGHEKPPKLYTRLDAIEVKTQGGPEDESLDDIEDCHREQLEQALSEVEEQENGGEAFR